MPVTCEVLYVKKVGNAHTFAHCKLGDLHGDLPCGPNVKPGPANVESRWTVAGGRLVVTNKVVQ